MSTEEQDKLQQQRDRRKRINRIKTGIIMTISIWMLVSFISIIVLCICLIKTNIKLNKFINSISVSLTDTIFLLISLLTSLI